MADASNYFLDLLFKLKKWEYYRAFGPTHVASLDPLGHGSFIFLTSEDVHLHWLNWFLFTGCLGSSF